MSWYLLMLASVATRILIAGLLSAALPAGCHVALPCAREEVSASLACATGLPLGPAACPGETALPPDVSLTDGLTEAEAVVTALWNNAAYQTLLAELGISRADLLEASLLTDPSLQVMFPAGTKLWEWTLMVPLEAFWLRPQRIQAARLNLDQSIATLVQRGWDLVRDVRLAHADLVLAQDRARLAADALRLRAEIADLADRRLAAGDISELEATTTRIEVLQAEALAERVRMDVEATEARLQTLLGLAQWDVSLEAVAPPPPVAIDPTVEDLVAAALASRADARAAAISVAAAQQRLGVARGQWMQVTGLVDANERAEGGFEYGPGALLTLPVFNGNRGDIARAEAELDRALRNSHAVREQIVREVATAHAQMLQARTHLDTLRTRILPTVQRTVELATRNFEEGGTSYFLVLQTTSQFLDARTRELELRADLQKAIAELERSAGRRLAGPPAETDESPPLPLEPLPNVPLPLPAPVGDAPAGRAPGPGATVPATPFRLGCRPVRLMRHSEAAEEIAEDASEGRTVGPAPLTTFTPPASQDLRHSRQSDAHLSIHERLGSRMFPARLRGGIARTREASAGDGADAPARGAPRAGDADAEGR